MDLMRFLRITIIYLGVICQHMNAKIELMAMQDICTPIASCQECIQIPVCAWCYQFIDGIRNGPKCFDPASNLEQCSENYTYFPHNHLEVTRQKAFTGKHSPNGEIKSETIQLTPQRIQLQLKVGVPQSIHVSYMPTQEHPVDLYYLMDLSKSMEDDKEKLPLLGDLLVETMRKIAEDFQIGFGSFVDKTVMPFINDMPAKLIKPCQNCIAPYGYLNHLRLTTNSTAFSNAVNKVGISGSLDGPEGGFDAIIQAIVCKQQIGWRDEARKLIVFATDNGFHYAGDGKVGGIITPNDGQCHLDAQGSYTYSNIQDFPSISHVNAIAQENAVNIIFAVTKESVHIYNKLEEHIEGSSSGILSEDSGNIIELVEKQYKQILSKVEMRDNATNGIEITYYSNCSSTVENNTNICKNLTEGQVINFRLEALLKECPKDPSKWNQKIKVHPVGLSEGLIIEVHLLCSCPCAHPSLKCQAIDVSKYPTEIKSTGCTPTDSTDIRECSGRGTCLHNECICNKRDNLNELIYGSWCQCDNYSCYYYDGQMCNGNGICNCGECKCESGWSGEACECSSSTCFPLSKENSTSCNGHGDCVCGICNCHNNFTGPFCESCPTCHENKCIELKSCVLCEVSHLYYYSDDTCLEKCQNITFVKVSTIEVDEDTLEQPCIAFDENHCTYMYAYEKINENHIEIKIKMEGECHANVSIKKTIVRVITSIVVPGLIILLIFKFLVTVYDRRKAADTRHGTNEPSILLADLNNPVPEEELQ